MALATQCPHCNTLFRVAHDQLKLRGGIVRCGACNEIFDGNAALVDVAAGSTAAAPTPASLAAALSATAAFDAQVAATEQTSTPPADAGPVYTLDFNTTFDPLGILPKAGENEPVPEPDARQTPLDLEPAPKGDPDLDLDFDVDEEFSIPPSVPTSTIEVAARLQRIEPRLDMVIDEPSTPPPPLAVPAVRIEPVLADLPAADAADAAETAMPAAPADAAGEQDAVRAPDGAATPGAPMAENDDAGIVINLPLDAPGAPPDLALELAPPLEMEEPGFVKRSRQQEKWRRAGRWLMGLGSVLLVGAALAQGVRAFRNELAAGFPPLRQPLQAACRALACSVQLPTQISKLSIDIGELQALPGGMFALTTQLHNQSGTLQTWPHIDLLLKDPAGKQLLRRVVTPADYLPAQTDPSRGFPARTDQNIKLYFALDQVQASDYNIVVFYP